MSHSISRQIAFTAPLLLLLSACGVADPAAPSETSDANEPLADYGDGVVIATLKPTEQQTIQVVEYPEGVVGIAEWHGPEFDSTTPLAMANFRDRTMAEFYERVAGEALDVAVLEKLVVTSELAQELAQRTPDFATPESTVPEREAPTVHTRAGLECAQDALFYTRYSSGWGSEYCSAPPGWEDAWCRTDDPTIEKGWTHGERWMIQIKNMSRCNTAQLLVKMKKESLFSSTTRYLLNNEPIGPSGGGMFWWEISSRDWRWYTKFSHLSGNEQSHLNLANYRQW
jgi:hypothetical protein